MNIEKKILDMTCGSENCEECNTCAHYQPRTFYCEYYLRGKETAVYLCSHCRSESTANDH